MEMVYLINGNESGGGGGSGGGGTPTGYRLVKAVVTDGAVGLQDKCVTRVELNTSDPVRINFPPKTEGVARDFLVRVLITSADVPEVMFAAPSGEEISFEQELGETFACRTGINIFAFTETDEGCFVANRKLVDIARTVSFDANGGSLDEPTRTYVLGSTYGAFPATSRRGYNHLGWYTEAGVRVYTNTKVYADVSRLVAHWDVYVDKFAPEILDSGEALFTTDGNTGWMLEDDSMRGKIARSGVIRDSQRSSLYAEAEGAGRIQFAWRVSSEATYDKAIFLVDGVQKATISGEKDWSVFSVSVAGDGRHEFEWRYVKDSGESDGSDCVWLDCVRWEAS